MALVVEDGTGLANADAYVSEAFVDAYDLDYVNDATWQAATSTVKERSIRQATQYLDAVYGTRWNGEKLVCTQSLDWPRCSVYDSDGCLLDSDSVPVGIERACAELAIRAATGSLLVDQNAGGGLKKLKQKVAVLEQEKEWFSPGNSSTQTTYPIIDSILISDSLIRGGNTAVRG